MNERQRRETDASQHQAHRNQFSFTELFDELANRTALYERADDSAIHEQRRSGRDRFRRFEAKLKVSRNNESERNFKTGEAKRREEENNHQQSHCWLAQRVFP